MNRRMIASEAFTDEWFITLDHTARVFWFGLIVVAADDQGRFQDNPLLLRSMIFPADDIALQVVSGIMDDFQDAGRVLRYKTDGKALGQILNWWKHQHPTWAAASAYPAPDGWVDRVKVQTRQGIRMENWSTPGGFSNTWEPEKKREPVQAPPAMPLTLAALAAPFESRAEPRAPKVSKHPAILAWKKVVGRYPPEATFRKVVGVLGEAPDTDKLAEAYGAWRLRGFNPNNIAGVLEWYEKGVPTQAPGRPGRRAEQPPIDAQSTDETLRVVKALQESKGDSID